jgi:hypothetical protein
LTNIFISNDDLKPPIALKADLLYLKFARPKNLTVITPRNQRAHLKSLERDSLEKLTVLSPLAELISFTIQ